VTLPPGVYHVIQDRRDQFMSGWLVFGHGRPQFTVGSMILLRHRLGLKKGQAMHRGIYPNVRFNLGDYVSQESDRKPQPGVTIYWFELQEETRVRD